jgi:phosphatidylserine/phosphatidylglycerophosphate/cardiolipin synthase-like enzyme
MLTLFNFLYTFILVGWPSFLMASTHLEFFSSVEGKDSLNTFFTREVQETESIITSVYDQFTDQEIASRLKSIKENNPSITVQILTGDNKECEMGVYQLLDGLGTQVIKAINGKMHNKFMVRDEKYITSGSPNITFNAFKFNIESGVRVRNQELTKIYSTYFQYIKWKNMFFGELPNACYSESFRRSTLSFAKEITLPEPEEADKSHLKSWLERFNRQSHIKVCLAPLMNIIDFIKGEMEGATKIHINMFLVSRGRVKGNDIIAFLVQASRNGTDIELMIDGKQFNACSYIREAIKVLEERAPNIKITKVLVKDSGYFHDKLILVTKHTEKIVIIGSAGFSRNVHLNKNYENMLSIRDEQTFKCFADHIDTIKCKSRKIKKLTFSEN